MKRMTGAGLRTALHLVSQFVCTALCALTVVGLLPASTLAQTRDSAPPRVSGDALDLTVHDPIYFVAGGSGDIKARFQISFKYRLLHASDAWSEARLGFQGLYFGYTQRALWNLEEDSVPFEDSSYNPSLFADFAVRKSRLLPDYFRTGYEHESNGQGGEFSRSIDTYYVWPFWTGSLGSRQWVVAPKLWAYLNTGSKNEDIQDYRGNAELLLRYGNEKSWLISAVLRGAEEGRATATVDFSYPFKNGFLERTGAFLYLQLFDGYGESLLTYNEERNAQVRIGFGFVR